MTGDKQELRLRVAISAMEGLLHDKNDIRNSLKNPTDDMFRSVAILSLAYADALIKEWSGK